MDQRGESDRAAKDAVKRVMFGTKETVSSLALKNGRGGIRAPVRSLSIVHFRKTVTTV